MILLSDIVHEYEEGHNRNHKKVVRDETSCPDRWQSMQRSYIILECKRKIASTLTSKQFIYLESVVKDEQMNRFMDFFCGMNDEEWENFSVYVLRQVGFIPRSLPAYGVDGGQDYLVENADQKYLVSCKHYIRSGKHVGQDDEQNISDRLLQFNATGFIGFYSTEITTGLQKRLDGICNNRQYNYLIFEPQKITQIMQSMDTKILQSFGLYPNKYYMNVSKQNYQPLKCVCCGKDILTDENIPNSIAGLAEYKDGTYGYVYGCKPCLRNVKLYLGAFLEIEQALNIKWLQDWDRTVDEWIAEDKLLLRNDFYQMRYKFAQRVRQRQLPQTDGTWYGLEPDDF